MGDGSEQPARENGGDAPGSERRNRYIVLVVLCLTLGLAPFFPQPHIVHKLRWIAAGGAGMGIIDWLDIPFHGVPWALLLATAGIDVWRKVAGKDDRDPPKRSHERWGAFALLCAAVCVAWALAAR